MIIEDVKGRRKRQAATESDEDYGFHYPFKMIRGIYWERAGSDKAVYPDNGGMLDQDTHLMADLKTFGWLVDLQERIQDRDEALAEGLKGQHHA